MAKALTSLSLDIALTTRRVGTGDRVTRQILSSSIFHRSWSVHSCVHSPGGDAFDFTAADFFGWCREVGFSRTEVIRWRGSASAGVAYK